MGNYSKEQVLTWYKSLKDTMLKAGIDMNKPGDLMRIRAFYFRTGEGESAGTKENLAGERVFAFIPRNKTQDGLMTEYLSKPKMPDAETQDLMDAAYEVSKDDTRNFIFARRDLTKVYKDGKNKDVISQYVEDYKTKENKRKESFDKMNRFFNESLSDYERWLISGQKLYDEEKDYDQIEELFKLAKEGLLYYNPLNGEPTDRFQILVNGDGKSEIGKNSNDKSRKNITHKNIFSLKENKPEEFAKLEEKYGKIDIPKEFTEKEPKEPEKVSKPGAWSWFKRIVSFGIVKNDFIKYDNYQNELRDFPNKVETYNTRKEENRLFNEKCIEQAEKVLNDYCSEEYPKGVENPGRLASNLVYMHESEFSPILKPEPEKGIFNEGFKKALLIHETNLQFEISESPQSFDENGNRNKEVSDNYWKDKTEILNSENTIQMEKDEKNLKEMKLLWELKNAEKAALKEKKNVAVKEAEVIEQPEIQPAMK